MRTDDVVLARAGDTAAFERIAVSLARRFHSAAYGILRDADAARDAAQQALLGVWRDLPQLRDPERFEAWAFRILVRTCRSEGGRARRARSVELDPNATDASAPDDLGAVVDRDRLERGFQRISFDQRAVVVLHVVLDLTLDQVAATLGIPIGTARSRHHRAIAALRAAIMADDRLPTPAPRPQEAAR
jgi:RNA polymerase sigma-70 factor (ECF subfamily)